ncbi:hypothetical protein GOBAR_AA25753 [Gossypium barbadense]|uniref:Reverse transcriptase zinc-binding domain-containing protein n=1 Tax=Gossypium barbadense TaxID=3634 RepID=A0A2P5WV52_GOSBA|nr:hypothetical protein GOBAR_AA25753 [Gossypium barbadense]
MEGSVSHVFWECMFIKGVLQGVGIDGSSSSPEQNWNMWLANSFLNMQEEQCKWLVITFWAIWYHKNKVCHQGERQCTTRLISFIKALYTENIQLEVVTEVGVRKNECAWTPSRINVVKGRSVNHVAHIMAEEGKRWDLPRF